MQTNDSGAAARKTLATLAVLGVVAAVGVGIYRGAGPFPDREGCHVEVGAVSVDLSLEQSENAALIAAIGRQRGLPARAVSIALATAYQESDIKNLDGGDRDSLGMFQQRPSQGWGTEEQIRDPAYATNKFYDALMKVDGYENMRITEAAQAVQVSGFPDAYEDHEADGRAIASALTGYSPRAFTCVVHRDDVPDEKPEGNGLTDRADDVRRDLGDAFGELALGGFEPGGVSTGHMEGSAHYEGRAVDIFVRPVNEANNRMGWVLAHYLLANAGRLQIEHVIFDDRIWTVDTLSEAGWRDYDPGSRPGDKAILEHRDHVHVDVLG